MTARGTAPLDRSVEGAAGSADPRRDEPAPPPTSRSRRASRFAWSVVAVDVALTIVMAILAVSNARHLGGNASGQVVFGLEFVIGFGVVVVAFGVVGALIVAQRPDNLVGWLFVVDATLMSISLFVGAYAFRALSVEPGRWPGGAFFALAGDTLYVPLMAALTVFLFLLYPDGRLRSRAERRVAGLTGIGIVLAVLAGITEPTLYGYPHLTNPLGFSLPRPAYEVVASLGFVLVLGGVIASLVVLVQRVRRSRGRERDQLRLLVGGAAVATLLFVPSFLQESPPDAVVILGGLGVLALPASVGVAILRHRLFDIDLVIRRAVVFGLLAAFITAIYVAVVVAVPALLVGPSASGFDLLPFAAAAIIAIAFQPLRRRAQQIASRIVYGDRASPYDVLAELASRMSETYEATDLLPRIARGLAEGSGARRAEVWLRIGSELRRTAVWPSEPERTSEALALAIDELPQLPAEHVVEVRQRGELLGALTVDMASGVELSDTEQRLLDDVASQAGIALRNARLTEELRAHVEELRASRQRLVAAQDTERRRLERDIHDGAQQQLVALAVKARLAEQLADRDADKARAVMGEVRAEATEALETLRDLARGIYPPVLADRGLVEALQAQLRKAPIPVRVEADGLGRYAQEVEATVYFCCLEAVQNAAKYAEPSDVSIWLAQRDGSLSFRVTDDGRGFDPKVTPPGMGLTNMRDRVEATGGTLRIDAAPGSGATIEGSVPATPA